MNPSNCPCDEIIFPPQRVIPAGLSSLPRQIASFPEFRAAMLSAIAAEPALNSWRARGNGDFGIMLLEMWAYVCDCIAFYDEAIANESYLRTAQRQPSLRKLVGLLGYLPRPAIAARVDLAILAEGRQPITLPPGMAFRSGGFPGGSPQVFELDTAVRVHPFTNRWTLARNRRLALEPSASRARGGSERRNLLFDSKSTRVKAGQLVLVENMSNPANTRGCKVASIEDFSADDGVTYKQMNFDRPLPIPGTTLLANLRVTTPTQTSTLWKHGFRGSLNVDGPFNTRIDVPDFSLSFSDGFFTGLYNLKTRCLIFFDGLRQQIGLGDNLVLERSGEFRWFKAQNIGEIFIEIPQSDTKLHARVAVTWIELDVGYNDSSRRDNSARDWEDSDTPYIKVYFDFRPAGTPTVSFDLTLKPGDAMLLTPPVEPPQDGKSPSRFLLEDKDFSGIEISAEIDFTAKKLVPVPAAALLQTLIAPVTAYGNVVTASRGETVAGEVLGSGNASIGSQTFKLKKSPLTYQPAPTGVASTLTVYVNGLQWTEVPSFFGTTSAAEVYIVRQNDDGDSFVTFGDGARGSRLPSGNNNVVAYYRYGAGKASPPSGSIHQMAKPIKGITGVRNPVAAAGGDDAEGPEGLRTYAPRSALLLGRAISIADMEAATAEVGGVRAVRVEWRWNPLRQRPVVQVWYVGSANLVKDVRQKLRALSDSVAPIDVEHATPVPGSLSLSIQIDSRRIEGDVLIEIRKTLMNKETGLLAAERIGIGSALFRSRIFEIVLGVPGAVAVTGLLWNGRIFNSYGIQPGSGKYFDLEAGALILNGKADDRE